jgi:hypothetical protein
VQSRTVNVHSAAAGLFVLGVIFAALTAAVLPFLITFDGRFEVLNAARALAETGTLADPFSTGSTGATAHVAPVFPGVAALLRWLPFDWGASLILLGVVLCGLNAALLPYASQALWGDWRPGMIGGVFLALGMRLMPQQDTALSSMLAVAGCIAMARGVRGAGLMAGLAVLANPVNALGLGPLLLFEPAKKARRAAVIGVALVCLPWIARNWVVLGSPAPVRDNFGLELALGNNACAEVGVAEATECFTSGHPGYSQVELERVQKLGEIGYNREKLVEALRWMAERPGRAATLAAGRARRYFLPGLVQDGHTAPVMSVVTVIGLAGLLLGRIRWASALPIAAGLSWLPYVLLQVQTDPRYRTYSLWIWCLMAGYVIWGVVERRAERES